MTQPCRFRDSYFLPAPLFLYSIVYSSRMRVTQEEDLPPPPHEPGPVQGFFLLRGVLFFCLQVFGCAEEKIWIVTGALLNDLSKLNQQLMLD